MIFGSVGAWRSLVAHLLWEQRVGGSNPSAPTTLLQVVRHSPELRFRSLVGRGSRRRLGSVGRRGRRRRTHPIAAFAVLLLQRALDVVERHRRRERRQGVG